MPRNSAAVARALSVWSKTSTERAMMPSQSPELVDRVGGGQAAEGGPPEGVSQACYASVRCTSYFISAQLFLHLHKFPGSLC